MNAGGVVHVVAAGEIGGAERMLVDLARSAPDGRTHSIALFTPNPALRALFRDAGIPIDDRGEQVREGPLPFLSSSLGSADVRWLAGVLERRRAAIAHLHTFASQVLGTRAAERARTRIVRTEHSTRVYDDPTCWPFARWSLPRADAVACISEHVQRRMGERAGALVEASRVQVIHNGVDVARFVPEPTGGPGPVRFVALGRLDARKGLDLALEALVRVPNAELDIVGDGDERSALEEVVRRLRLTTRVHFRGYAADVRPAIARSDVILSSAREEGLGIAVLEAMACARPVVAVPVGGLVEIVDDGVTGWLAGSRTAVALAEAMKAAAADPAERQKRGAAARERVVARFSLAAMRAGYARTYESVERTKRHIATIG